MQNKRFPETVELIRQEFPGDVFKPVRHELYTFMYAIPSGFVGDKTMKDWKPETVESSSAIYRQFGATNASLTDQKLELIHKSLVEERKGMTNLRGLLWQILEPKIKAEESFSIYDITKAVRARVNESRLVLLDDRDYVELEIIPGTGVTGLTQKIEHEEVRKLVLDFLDHGRMPGYTRKSAGKYFVYYFDATKGASTVIDPHVSASPLLDSAAARVLDSGKARISVLGSVGVHPPAKDAANALLRKYGQ